MKQVSGHTDIHHIDGLIQYLSNSNALAMELSQSCYISAINISIH